MRLQGLVAFGLSWALGCGSAGSSADDSSTSSDAQSSSTGATGDPSSPASAIDDSSASSGASSSEGGPPTVCGDGQVDRGEVCDDGNDVDGDECDADCTLPDLPLWSYVGDADTSLNSLVVAADGSVVAGGTFGNPWDFGSATALLRALGPDGSVVAEVDAIVPGEGYVFDVVLDEGGRFWLLGARVANAWMHRIDGNTTDERTYAELEGFAHATIFADGIAVTSFADVAMLDAGSGELLWYETIGRVDDSALASNGDIIVVGGPSYNDPRELLRFAPDGTQVGTPIMLDGTYCAVDAGAIGIAVICIPDLNTITSVLRLYDDAGTMLWSNELPKTQAFDMLMTDDAIVLVGGTFAAGPFVPAAIAFTPDGAEAWRFAPPPSDYGFEGGAFTDAAVAPDGVMVFAGSLDDLAADRFEPPQHAFIIRYAP